MIIAVILIIAASQLQAQWSRSYGAVHENGTDIVQTGDGGYIIAGYTESFGAGGKDILIVKLDAAGDIEWEHTYGFSTNEAAHSIAAASDGGYVVAGYIDTSGDNEKDIWIFKIDASGSIVWQKTFPSLYDDELFEIQAVSDGGFIAAGYKSGVTIYPPSVHTDILAVKLSGSGSIEWTYTGETAAIESLYSIKEVTNQGYIAVGKAYNPNGTTEPEIFVLKLRSDGSRHWQKGYGFDGIDIPLSVNTTNNNRFIIAGYRTSSGHEVSDRQVFLLNLKSNGTFDWGSTGGMADCDEFHHVQQTRDGGFIAAGRTLTVSSGYDALIAKYDAQGTEQWVHTFGDTYDDSCMHIRELESTSGFIAVGSLGVDISRQNMWVMKLNSQGEISDECDLQSSSSLAYDSIAFDDYLPFIFTASASFTPSDTTAAAGPSAVTMDEQCFNDNPVPEPFSLLSPADNAVEQPLDITLDWENSSNAVSYEVYFGNSTPPPYLIDVSQSHYTPLTLDPGTTYYWQVVATNGYGDTPSAIWSFSTGTAPQPFNLLTPADGSTTESTAVTLDWEDSTDASSYEIYFGTSSPPPYIAETPTSQYDPGTLNEAATYYWKIRAVNDIGGTDSTEWSFTTPGEEPGAFNLLTPADGAADISLTPTLTWENSAHASSYDVYFGTSSSPPLRTNITQTQYSPGKLAADTTYYWRVIAKNNLGEASSATWSFQTGAAPAAPTLLSPENSSITDSTSVVLDWGDGENAETYKVYLGTSSPAPFATTVTDSQYSITLSEDTQYYWKIEAVNEFGTVSSSQWTFTTPGTPPSSFSLLQPPNGSTDQPINLLLTWEASENAVSYDVYFGMDSNPPLRTNTSSLQYNPGTLNPGTNYYWKIIAKNSFGEAASDVWSFQTEGLIPEAFGLTSPSNGTSDQSIAINLEWSSSRYATSYDVYFGQSSNPGYVATVTDTFFDPGTLEYMSLYYWKIVAKNDVGSIESQTWRFSTQSTPEYNEPSSYQILPEVIWADASKGGTWMTEVQITDVTGGSEVQVYFNYLGGSRQGPITIWASTGAYSSVKFENILSRLKIIDPTGFDYFGKIGALEFITQDSEHKIQVSARTKNGDFSKTFPGLNYMDANLADPYQPMLIQDLVSNEIYRSTLGCFNVTDQPVDVEFQLLDEAGIPIGSAFSKTVSAFEYLTFLPFAEAGIPYPDYSFDNTHIRISPTSGEGRIFCFGATANNFTNDPAAHIATQIYSGYENSPSSAQIIPEAIWAPAVGDGTWNTGIQITDLTGGSEVSVYFHSASGESRGPFDLWSSAGVDCSAKFPNILEEIDILDPGDFDYYNQAGSLVFMTQDQSHFIQVSARTANGNFSKTFPGLNYYESSNFANPTQSLMVHNLVNNNIYRTAMGCFNPESGDVTVRFRLIDDQNSVIGSPFNRTISGHEFISINPFTEAGVPYPDYSNDNVIIEISVTSGSGKVIVFGATANNNTNDPAAHIPVQFD